MACTDCVLHESAIFCNKMAGRGPSDARIMLVGQGPAGYEDVQGQPFVGKSGKLLDAMLADAGFDPDELYFTNATRCRAPGDRAPTPEEVNACRKHLIEEVHRVRPDVIVALGDVALRSLCKQSGIKSKRGQEFQLHPDFSYEGPVWATYHPAAVLRTPTLRRTVVSDLRKVRDRLLTQDEVPWKWWSGERIEGAILSYDIETVNEAGEIVEYPTQLAVCNGAEVFVSRDVLGLAKQLKGRTLIGHNSLEFDNRLLFRYTDANASEHR